MGSIAQDSIKKPIHIAIIGGGIGGAVLGIGISSLPQSHVTFAIYEVRPDRTIFEHQSLTIAVTLEIW